MHITIIDDKKSDREYLSEMIHNCFLKNDIPVNHITTFENGETFLQDFEKEKYDLIFLDIYMDGANGIEIAEKIRESDKDVKLVFVTISNDFASESYSVAAAYYLCKPFCETDVKQMMDRLRLNEQKLQKVVTLPNGQPLLLESIVYTSFSGHYVTIHLISGEQLRIRYSQKKWEDFLLPFSDFILCTKGVIVNLREVEKLHPTLFVMKNKDYISISRRKYPEVKQAYFDFLIKKARRRGK